MKQLTTRANRPLPHPHSVQCWNPAPPSPSMEVTVYSIEDGKRLGLDYGLEGAGGSSGGSIEGLACIHVFMVIMAAKRSTARKVGLRLCSAGFTKSAKRGEPPQMVPSMSTERPRASRKLAHKKPLTGATPYGEATETRVATEEGGVTTDGGYVDRSAAGQRKRCRGGDSNTLSTSNLHQHLRALSVGCHGCHVVR